MSSVVTITFSPCIDKSASVPVMVPEKKLHCSSVKLEPGGGGINVARALTRLGASATAIFLSGGYTGKFFHHLVENEKIPFIGIETAGETRENIIIFDEHTNNQYRFGMPASPVTEEEWKNCIRVLQEVKDPGFIVVSGSLPPGIPLSIYSDLSVIAHAKKSKLVVDTSGDGLAEALHHGVYMIKPNLNELRSLAGLEKLEITEVVAVAKKLIREYNCQLIVVSLGKHGAMLITQNESIGVMPPKVKVKSTVGAGDSMLAGMIWGLCNGFSERQAFEFAVACGTAATLNPGTELCKKADADKLYHLIRENDHSQPNSYQEP